MDWATILNWISVVFAALAAGFWLWSATVSLPERITSGFGGSGGSAQVLGDALRWQARLSALGATCASVAAASHAVALALTA